MDYTKVPRSLIYCEHRSLKEFGAYKFESITRPLADAMLKIYIIQDSDSERRALWFMNSAFYICTMIMMEEDPRWRISEYKEIASPSNWPNVNVPECQILTLSLVLVLLNHLETPLKDSHPFGESVRTAITDILYNEENMFTYNNLNEELKKDPFASKTIANSMFAPRVIDKETIGEVLKNKDTDWGIFTNYLEERSMRDIIWSLGSTENEKYNVLNMLKEASRSTSLARWNDRPDKLDAMLNDIEEEIYHHFNYDPEADQAIAEAEIKKWEKTIDLAPYEARIKELEIEVERLTSENKELKKQQPTQKPNNEDTASLKQQIADLEKEKQLLSQDKEDMIIELLKPIFYGDEQDVKDFLNKIDGRSDTEITDTVYEYLKVRKISDKSKNRPLWMVLHAARLYRATEQNWTKALREHP